MQKVLIAIQARSGSKRLPNKIAEYIGKKTILERILSAALSSTTYVSELPREKVSVNMALLIPKDDPIKKAFQDKIHIVEGPENDVLTRYSLALSDYDFIVRLTADCPVIPAIIISKCILLALMNDYDFVSNADERFRTAPDGFDCEVMSRAALEYSHKHAKSKYDREHVTSFIKKKIPSHMKAGTLLNYLDRSHEKWSVDTLEDLIRIRKEVCHAEKKYSDACKAFGKSHTHLMV